ncbi:MAG: glycosyltransferase family 1 protein [Methylococcaceae bacterium]|nr:glycosyltransferase family 1 protein [Methylococcaceae bacterium]
MKIGLQTWGSNGDIRPMLALAGGLQKAGHQVTLAITSIDNQSYQDISEKLGITYLQVPMTIDFNLLDFANRSYKMNTLQWLRGLLDESLFPSETAIYQTAKHLVADNDCVIGHHFLYPLKLAAMQHHKPFFSLTFCHAAIPMTSYPPFRFPNLGVYSNKLAWQLLDLVFNWALKKPLTRLWISEGQTPPTHMLTDLLTSQQLDLVAVDPLFCNFNREWTANHKACGFLNLTEDTVHWTLPNDLALFLQEGEPPVYMTFGSMQQAVPEWSVTLFLEAVKLADCRAIIQTELAQYTAASRLGQVYFIGKHPHQAVFEKCAAVVHHGGAGTTHSATLAACPSIVIPFMDEQLFWAHQLQALGLALTPLPAKKVNAKLLAKAIRRVLTVKSLQEKAVEASLIMQTHNGVAMAVQLVESQMHDLI